MEKKLNKKSQMIMFRDMVKMSLHYQVIQEMMTDVNYFEDLSPVEKLRVMELMRLGQEPNEHLARVI